MAVFVVNKYVGWRNNCTKWLDQSKELRNYLFQTSTKDTTNAKLPNSETTSTLTITQLCSLMIIGSNGKQLHKTLLTEIKLD